VKRIGVVILTLIASLALAADKDDTGAQVSPSTVVFTGGQLTGALVSATSKSISFANKATGLLTIQWTDIQSLTVGSDMLLKLKVSCSGCPQSKIIELKGATLAVNDHTIVSGVPREAGPIQLANLLSIYPKEYQTCPGPSFGEAPSTELPAPPLTSDGWHLAKVKIGFAVLGATQKDQTYNGEADIIGNWNAATCGWPHQRTKVTLIPSYDDKRKNSLPGSANVTRYYSGTVQHLLFVDGNRTYLQVLGDFYHNNSLGIYFQQSYGAGVGTTIKNLELDADLRFVGQHFYSPGQSEGLIGTLLSERYYIPLSFIVPNASLSETGKVLPVFNASRAWQAHGIVELSIPFTPKIAFTASAFDDYVDNAPAKFNKNYFKTTVGIAFSPTAKK
jgi:hypothetical protein